MAYTASASRTGDYSQVHTCRSCRKEFWAKSSWNGVTVQCPHCSSDN
ncbi:hypothetical protein [Arthrobacter yangruifuii]|nr:hypothetical protein [Arthrobacter yangruifuii]